MTSRIISPAVPFLKLVVRICPPLMAVKVSVLTVMRPPFPSPEVLALRTAPFLKDSERAVMSISPPLPIPVSSTLLNIPLEEPPLIPIPSKTTVPLPALIVTSPAFPCPPVRAISCEPLVKNSERVEIAILPPLPIPVSPTLLNAALAIKGDCLASNNIHITSLPLASVAALNREPFVTESDPVVMLMSPLLP